MKIKYHICLMLLLVCPATSFCQTQEAESAIKTTLCEIYKNPEQYANKMVQVSAGVSGDGWMQDTQRKACTSYTQVLLVYPEKIKPSPGFALVHDDSLAKWLEAARTGKGVEAMFEGRIDIAFVWREKKKISVGTDRGYGRKSQYGARFVLHKVSDVVVFPGTRL